jgi:hypothetical protein
LQSGAFYYEVAAIILKDIALYVRTPDKDLGLFYVTLVFNYKSPFRVATKV